MVHGAFGLRCHHAGGGQEEEGLVAVPSFSVVTAWCFLPLHDTNMPARQT